MPLDISYATPYGKFQYETKYTSTPHTNPSIAIKDSQAIVFSIFLIMFSSLVYEIHTT